MAQKIDKNTKKCSNVIASDDEIAVIKHNLKSDHKAEYNVLLSDVSHIIRKYLEAKDSTKKEKENGKNDMPTLFDRGEKV